MEESKNQPDPFQMLYRARWNVPQAAAAVGLPACEESWTLMKESFRNWCSEHQPDYKVG